MAYPIWIIKRCSVEIFGVLVSSIPVKGRFSQDGELQEEETTEDDGEPFSEKLSGPFVVAEGGTLSSSCGGGGISKDGARKTRAKLTEIHILPPTLYAGCGVWRSGR